MWFIQFNFFILFMLYRTSELKKKIGEKWHKEFIPSRVLYNLLSSFNVLREKIVITFHSVLVKNVADQNIKQVLCYLLDFFWCSASWNLRKIAFSVVHRALRCNAGNMRQKFEQISTIFAHE